MTQYRRGPVPATHTGICPVCRTRQAVRTTTGTLWHHGGPLRDCDGWQRQPVPGSLEPIGGRADLTRGADEVMGRAYVQLAEAAQHLTVQHPAAEPVGRAIDTLAGWLGRRTIIIGGNR